MNISRSTARFFAAAVAVGVITAPTHSAADQNGPGVSSAALHISVTFAPRMNLRTSAEILTFHVTGTAAEATLNYSAGLRVPTGSVVELIAEVDMPASSALTVAAGAEPPGQSEIESGEPTAIASWSGSGLRTGTVTFRLAAPPGIYQVPVRMRLAQR